MANILVVEDDKINAKLFELVLTRVGGFAVTVTEDADEVIRIASEGQADLILMDVSLSNTEYEGVPVDGIELTRILKQDARTSSIPVVLTTAHALRGDGSVFSSSPERTATSQSRSRTTGRWCPLCRAS